jgi:hypothetical protein
VKDKLLSLWYRLLAWGHRQRRNAILQVELVGTLQGRIVHIAEIHGTLMVFTSYGDVYRVWYDYGYGGLRVKRVTP